MVFEGQRLAGSPAWRSGWLEGYSLRFYYIYLLLLYYLLYTSV